LLAQKTGLSAPIQRILRSKIRKDFRFYPGRMDEQQSQRDCDQSLARRFPPRDLPPANRLESQAADKRKSF
jgi:hypothetical protein